MTCNAVLLVRPFIRSHFPRRKEEDFQEAVSNFVCREGGRIRKCFLIRFCKLFASHAISHDFTTEPMSFFEVCEVSTLIWETSPGSINGFKAFMNFKGIPRPPPPAPACAFMSPPASLSVLVMTSLMGYFERSKTIGRGHNQVTRELIHSHVGLLRKIALSSDA